MYLSHLVRVHIDGDQRAKNLLLKDLVHRSGGLHHGWLNKVPNTVIKPSTSNNTTVGAALGMVDVARNAVKSFPVYDGRHEGVSICCRSDLKIVIKTNPTVIAEFYRP